MGTFNASADTNAILGFLLGKAINTGVKGYNNANQVRQYSQALNSAMPDGYKVPDYNGRFFFGDTANYAKALDAAREQQLNNWQGQYYADQTGLPLGPVDAMKNIYEKELAPIRQERGKAKVAGEQGRRDTQGAMVLTDLLRSMNHPTQKQAQTQQSTPLFPVGKDGITMEQDPLNGGVLQGGINQNQLPELPEDFYITPETLRGVLVV